MTQERASLGAAEEGEELRMCIVEGDLGPHQNEKRKGFFVWT